MSRASETRQDKYARIIGILGGDIFLGNEIHTVAQWSHEPNACGAIKPRKRRVAVGTVDVTDRRPIRLAIGAVDSTCGRSNLPLHIGVFWNFGTALGRDLQISHFAPPVRLRPEE